MSFGTTIPGQVLIGDDQIKFGTVDLGSEFGQVTSCELTRTGDEIQIEGANGGLQALIIANPGLELKLEATFTKNKTAPGIGDSVTFPEVTGVVGRVMAGASIKRTNKNSRTLSLTAKFWDSMAVETAPSSGIFKNPAYKVALDGTTTAIT